MATTEPWEVRQGDALALLREMPAESVDAIVTDPPYGLNFMGKEWDRQGVDVPSGIAWSDGINPKAGATGKAHSHGLDSRNNAQFGEWSRLWAVEALRVLKPGGHLVAFGGTRTYHRLACAIEDAGFDVRDCLMWLYGSGFPKSLDVSKAIDKTRGEERPVSAGRRAHHHHRGKRTDDGTTYGLGHSGEVRSASAITDTARQWQGWGTALKPAWEPIILARKPLIGTVAANVLAHGTGALNIDGCRIGTGGGHRTETPYAGGPALNAFGNGLNDQYSPSVEGLGRWPANIVLDEDAAALLDEQTGERRSAGDYPSEASPRGIFGARPQGALYADAGGASRFFYTSKASSGERHYAEKNNHPTVKPVDLMRWLCRLVTPRGGLVLDPFMGSGSTGIAALSEGFRFLGMDLDPEYCALASRRIVGPLFAGQP